MNVPFNDLEAAKATFAEHAGEFACMIVEPAMTNCGLVLPDPGYLAGLKELCHADGALFVFDEVKTGFALAWGGAVEAFEVVPDLVCLAKALGAGLPCGDRRHRGRDGHGDPRGELDQQGTFNGNPLTMARGEPARCLDEGRVCALRRAERDPRRSEEVIEDARGQRQAPGSEGLIEFRAADPRVPRSGTSTTGCPSSRGSGS